MSADSGEARIEKDWINIFRFAFRHVLSHYVEDYIKVVSSHPAGTLMYSCKTALVERIGGNMCCKPASPDVHKSVRQ